MRAVLVQRRKSQQPRQSSSNKLAPCFSSFVERGFPQYAIPDIVLTVTDYSPS